MKRIMNAKVCILLILILIGITFFAAYGTWSWTGAYCWCLKYIDGWGTASANVGWGGMSSGGWTTSATVIGEHRDHTASGGSFTEHGENPNPSGAAYSQVGNWATIASANSMINGTGQDGDSHDDSHSANFSPND
jgi:hypothetical protein